MLRAAVLRDGVEHDRAGGLAPVCSRSDHGTDGCLCRAPWCALGVTVKVLPHWDELIVELDGAPVSQIVPAKPLGVDMGRVLAVTAVIDQICDGTLPAGAAQSALESAGRLPPACTLRFTLFAAAGAASLGVMFGTLDTASLLLIAVSAAIGALVRRWLSDFSHNPLAQPLCAAFVAGIMAAAAGYFQLSTRWELRAWHMPAS